EDEPIMVEMTMNNDIDETEIPSYTKVNELTDQVRQWDYTEIDPLLRQHRRAKTDEERSRIQELLDFRYEVRKELVQRRNRTQRLLSQQRFATETAYMCPTIRMK